VRCNNQFRAVCADIEEVKTMNSKGSAKQEDQVLFLHDKAGPHTSLLRREATAIMRWTALPHPPYTHD
jgi:hypothetical protein